MQRPTKILIAEHEAAEREKLNKMLAAEAEFEVIGEARDGKECLELTTKQRPDLVLIRRDLPVVNGLDAAEQIAKEHPDVSVILILTGQENEEVWRKMVRLGIRDFVSRPLENGHLLEEIRKAVNNKSKSSGKAGAAIAPAVPEPPRNHVITVAGPRGGCGKSVVATNLACALAQNSDKISLVDLNLWGGDVAMLLDLTPRRTLGDLLPGFGGIDFDVVDSVMVKHSSGLSALPAPLSGSFDGTTLTRYIVQSILDAIREHYECTVVDTGFANLESTLAAMDASDVIVIVVGADLPRLRDGKHYLKNLLAANYAKEKIRVVISRATSSKEISPSEVESILEFPVTARIPHDEAVVSSSVNLGQPFVLSNPAKPVSKAIYELAESLVPTGVSKKRGSKWFSFIQ